MSTRFVHPLLGLVLTLLVALSGATSAGLMAPDRAEIALAALERAHGPLAGDFCGGDTGHDHSCPFCHGFPDAPEFRHSGRLAALVPHDGWRCHDALLRAARGRDHDHSPRAPPAAI